MTILERPVMQFVVAGAILGAISFILGAIGALKAATPLVLVLYLLIAATTLATGYAARRQKRRPAWSGALAGVLYGGIGGLAGFARTVTAAQVKAALKGVSAATVSVSQAVATANSPGIHVLAVVGGAILWGIVGLILGVIGSALAGGAEQQRRAV